MSNLSVIIPSKNEYNLRHCIRAIREAGEECRIIIMDDGIDLAKMTRSSKNGALRNTEIIKGKKPFVFARNCNIGIRYAENDDIILLNDDALLKSKNGFTILQREAESHPECGCLGAVTNVTGALLQRPQGRGFRYLNQIAFVCVLIPRRVINQIGLLDERYCIDYGVEDRDYCEMITLAGLRVCVHDGCYVDHGSLTSSYRGHPMAPGRSNQNRALFCAKFNKKSYFI